MPLPIPECIHCKIPLVLRTSKQYRYHNGDPKRFYGCPNWPGCNCTSGANPDGTPSSIPADDATKQARRNAHRIFDKLWMRDGREWDGKSYLLTRKRAYEVMQGLMGMSEEQAHIGQFSIDQCDQLIERLKHWQEVAGMNTTFQKYKGKRKRGIRK